MGVKLFAWLGGLGLFLGVGFFVKYSFDHDLIPPEVRVALGFVVGLALLAVGVWMAGRRYEVTAQTLCATGVVTLYAVTFACRSVYHFPFFGLIPTFLLMALITTAAFVVAVGLDALVVAILGMLGGFLTPVLLSTGQDNPLGLFSYVALLDVGLVAVALHRRWQFLMLCGAIGTLATEAGWVWTFFTVPKAETAIGIFLSCSVLFLGSFILAHREDVVDWWVSAAAVLPAVASVVFAGYLLTFADLGQRPGLVFGFVFAADVCLLVLAWLREELAPLQVSAGLIVFTLLAFWTHRHLTPDLLTWGLGLYLAFAVLHAALPVALPSRGRQAPPAWWIHAFPALALLLIMITIANGLALSLLVWPAVLLIDLLAVTLALLVPSALALLVVLVLTVFAAGLWMIAIPASIIILPSMLLVVGGIAVFFLAATSLVTTWLANQAPGSEPAQSASWLDPVLSAQLLSQLPALSAGLPFLLLLMLTQRLPLPDPSAIFGLAMVLVVLLLALASWLELEWLPVVGLVSAVALQHAWHFQNFRPDEASGPLLWYLGFYAIFLIFPFILRVPFGSNMVPWAAAALSGPLHFFVIYRAVKTAYPNDVMGLLPAAFAVPTLLGLGFLLQTVPPSNATRMSRIAWFGGVALFFVTLIFPIQFERQWLTIAWALEGMALLWLFHRVPHRGLPLTGVGLLLVAFVRLALNPAVLGYHPRSFLPIFNWYLYAYGIVTVCLLLGARLLRPPRNVILDCNAPPILTGLGTALAFLLVNIEIADYFTVAGAAVLTFQFAGNLARDMTYSIAWALFALTLIVVGLTRRLAVARYAGLGLLGVTLLKLFFHDLAHLAQLYRIGALLCVAVIAMLASFLYQRWLVPEEKQDAPAPS